MREMFSLLASYNTWMNGRVYEAASGLSGEEQWADRGAFFGSVLGTLNHITVADRIWLQRFAENFPNDELLSEVRILPRPQSLREILFSDLGELSRHRKQLDGVIERWVASLTQRELDQAVCYARLDGSQICKRFSSLLLHFFNHQTHHRGQVTTLLSQLGKDVGVTDLLALIPNEMKGC